MRSLISKERSIEDDKDDLRYFWSKTESLVKRLEAAGYIVALKPGYTEVRASERKGATKVS